MVRQDLVYIFDKKTFEQEVLGEIHTDFNISLTMDGTKDSSSIIVWGFDDVEIEPYSIIYHEKLDTFWTVGHDKVERRQNDSGFLYVHNIELLGAIELLNARDLTDCGFNSNTYTIREFILRLFKLSTFEFTPTLVSNALDLDKKVEFVKSFENYTLLSALREFLDAFNCCPELSFTIHNEQLVGATITILSKSGDRTLPSHTMNDFEEVRETKTMNKNSFGSTVVSNAENVISNVAKTFPSTGGVCVSANEYTIKAENAVIKLPSKVFKGNWLALTTTTAQFSVYGGIGGTSIVFDKYDLAVNPLDRNSFDRAIDKILNKIQDADTTAGLGGAFYNAFRNGLMEVINDVYENVKKASTLKLYNGSNIDPITGEIIKGDDIPYLVRVDYWSKGDDNEPLIFCDKEMKNNLPKPWKGIAWERGSNEITGFDGFEPLVGRDATIYVRNYKYTELQQDLAIVGRQGAGSNTPFIFYKYDDGTNQVALLTPMSGDFGIHFAKGTNKRNQAQWVVNYIPMSDIKIKVDNSRDRNDTQLYNQNGKLTDNFALSKLLNSYSKEISSDTITKFMTYYSFDDVPQVGSFVYDSNNTYVVNNVSCTFTQHESTDDAWETDTGDVSVNYSNLSTRTQVGNIDSYYEFDLSGIDTKDNFLIENWENTDPHYSYEDTLSEVYDSVNHLFKLHLETANVETSQSLDLILTASFTGDIEMDLTANSSNPNFISSTMIGNYSATYQVDCSILASQLSGFTPHPEDYYNAQDDVSYVREISSSYSNNVFTLKLEVASPSVAQQLDIRMPYDYTGTIAINNSDSMTYTQRGIYRATFQFDFDDITSNPVIIANPSNVAYVNYGSQFAKISSTYNSSTKVYQLVGDFASLGATENMEIEIDYKEEFSGSIVMPPSIVSVDDYGSYVEVEMETSFSSQASLQDFNLNTTPTYDYSLVTSVEHLEIDTAQKRIFITYRCRDERDVSHIDFTFNYTYTQWKSIRVRGDSRTSYEFRGTYYLTYTKNIGSITDYLDAFSLGTITNTGSVTFTNGQRSYNSATRTLTFTCQVAGPTYTPNDFANLSANIGYLATNNIRVELTGTPDFIGVYRLRYSKDISSQISAYSDFTLDIQNYNVSPAVQFVQESATYNTTTHVVTFNCDVEYLNDVSGATLSVFFNAEQEVRGELFSNTMIGYFDLTYTKNISDLVEELQDFEIQTNVITITGSATLYDVSATYNNTTKELTINAKTQDFSVLDTEIMVGYKYSSPLDNVKDVAYFIDSEITMSKYCSTKSLMVNPNTNIRDYGIPQNFNVKRKQLYRDFYELGYDYDSESETTYYYDPANVFSFQHTPNTLSDFIGVMKLEYNETFGGGTSVVPDDGGGEQQVTILPSDTYYYQLETTRYNLNKMFYVILDFNDNNIIGYGNQNVYSGFIIKRIFSGLYDNLNTPISYVDVNGNVKNINLLLLTNEHLTEVYGQYEQDNSSDSDYDDFISEGGSLFNYSVFIPKAIYDYALLKYDIEIVETNYNKDAIEVPVFEYGCQLDDSEEVSIGENVFKEYSDNSNIVYFYSFVDGTHLTNETVVCDNSVNPPTQQHNYFEINSGVEIEYDNTNDPFLLVTLYDETRLEIDEYENKTFTNVGSHSVVHGKDYAIFRHAYDLDSGEETIDLLFIAKNVPNSAIQSGNKIKLCINHWRLK